MSVSVRIGLQHRQTHTNWHLINMHSFLNSKFRDINIKCRIKNVDDFGLVNYRAIAMCKIRDKNA